MGNILYTVSEVNEASTVAESSNEPLTQPSVEPVDQSISDVKDSSTEPHEPHEPDEPDDSDSEQTADRSSSRPTSTPATNHRDLQCHSIGIAPRSTGQRSFHASGSCLRRLRPDGHHVAHDDTSSAHHAPRPSTIDALFSAEPPSVQRRNGITYSDQYDRRGQCSQRSSSHSLRCD